MKRLRELVPDGIEERQEHKFSFLDLIRDIHSLIMTTYLTPTAAWMVSRTCHTMSSLFKLVIPTTRHFPNLMQTVPVVSPLAFIADGYIGMVNIYHVEPMLNLPSLLAFDIPFAFLDGILFMYAYYRKTQRELLSTTGCATIENVRHVCRRMRLVDEHDNWDQTEIHFAVVEMVTSFTRDNNKVCLKWFFDTFEHPQRQDVVEQLRKTWFQKGCTLNMARVLDEIVPELWKNLTQQDVDYMCRYSPDPDTLEWLYIERMNIRVVDSTYLNIIMNRDMVNLLKHALTLPMAINIRDPHHASYVDIVALAARYKAAKCLEYLFTHAEIIPIAQRKIYAITKEFPLPRESMYEISTLINTLIDLGVPIGSNDNERKFVLKHMMRNSAYNDLTLVSLLKRDEIRQLPDVIIKGMIVRMLDEGWIVNRGRSVAIAMSEFVFNVTSK